MKLKQKIMIFLFYPVCCSHCLMSLGALKSIGGDQRLSLDTPVYNSGEDS